MGSVLGDTTNVLPEEGGMSNCLSAGRYRIVFVKAEVNKAGTEWAENVLNEGESVFAGPMLNEDLSKPISSWVKHKRGKVIREVARRGSLLARVMNDKREYGRLLGDALQRLPSQGP